MSIDLDYLAIIYGALLHDIGKIYQRSGKRRVHEELSKEFIEKHLSSIISNKNLVNKIIKYVCTNGEHTGLVKIADQLSASEREKEENIYEEVYKIPLINPFKNASASKEEYGHNLISLNISKECRTLKDFNRIVEQIRPVEGKRLSLEDYKKLTENFEKDIELLKNFKLDVEYGLFESLLNIIRKHMFFVPSAVYKTTPNISLYSHLSNTAGIASALYYSKEEKIVLLSIDISGMQKFIYSIANTDKSLSQLRGRSVLIDLLQRAITRYILGIFNLNSSSIIRKTGGEINIILPKMNGIENKIKDAWLNVEKCLLELFNGEIYSVYSIVDLSFRKRKAEPLSFKKPFDEAYKDLSMKKLKRFSTLISNGDTIFLEQYLFKHNISEIEKCDYCKRSFKQVKKTRDGGNICSLCDKSIEIGKAVRNLGIMVEIYFERKPRKNTIEYINKLTEKVSELEVSIRGIYFPYLNVGYVLIGRDRRSLEISLLVLKSIAHYEERNNIFATIYFINNEDFIPSDKVEKINELIEENRNIKLGFAFEYMYTYAPRTNGEIATFDELSENFLLGVLRMDGDSMGEITGKLREKLSIYHTAYEYIKLIFEGLIHMLTMTNKYKDYIYSVYSGGDDLFIVGRWDTIIQLAIDINKLYNKMIPYSDITISGGILIDDPKIPPHILAFNAKEMLESVKSEGKNGVSLYSPEMCYFSLKKVSKVEEAEKKHKLEWKDLEEIVEYGEKRVYRLLEEGKISTSILYKLDKISNTYNLGLSIHAKVELKRLLSEKARINIAYIRGRRRSELYSLHDILPNPEKSVFEEWKKYAILKYITLYTLLKKRHLETSRS